MNPAVTVFLFITLLVLPASAACPVAVTPKPRDVSKQLAIKKLSEFRSCMADDPMSDKSPCDTFAGRGLEAIYKVNDFKKADGGFLSANSVWDYVHASGDWVSLGGVFDEDNNLCAQAMANQAVPVIAVMKAPVHGHIALIIPGEAAKSARWNMLVAYSASFLYEHPEKSYVGGSLSGAFGPDNAKRAEFFYRKPN